jgi:Kef-type K+ transport system membrane component KefB
MTPQYIKLPITAIIIFSVVFIFLYMIGLRINIEKEQLFITSATLAMVSIPIVMPIIKKQD